MNILIAGVGGQGTLLASKVLGRYAVLCGKDCKQSEVHGMSQRGGSVTTHVRIGDKIHSPVIWAGAADIILAFEVLEAARMKHFLRPGGILLVNDIRILPMPCITGAAKYPDGLKEDMLEEINGAYFIPAADIAEEAGNVKSANVVMLGALCRLCGMDKEKMAQAISDCVPEKFRDVNLKAFALGYERVK
ncbi:MAG TPA: indolepyruvate oxidoreductase subunit beta [Candidatus Protoclostridium stercorigallinarum]|mgnify:FL=1|uniref:Indolepyruvate oxidoreductase subunit beta n=1 Tax=Candidatus Protoclostridium stercorigallinarum TaxID=2838741 RepID=A0A9D1PZB8_9FIRM|nr:indolepyruvate oxidoreductase subunit beta [Candidatus Protoclostridium stercorigallinarum]